MLILKDEDGKEYEARKVKDMSTQDSQYFTHRKKRGTIDGKGYDFHHYNYGPTYYFVSKENNRWYKIDAGFVDNLNFEIVKKVRE